MKNFTNIIIFFGSLITVFSQELPFKVERMITDYRGVVTNGKNILCYGDYGIITHTLDFGKTFKQLNIGDKHNIKCIKVVGDDFVGITDNSLVKSTTNGLTWEIKEVFGSSRIIDMVLYDKTMYLLTPTGVYTADNNLNVSVVPIVSLDSNSEYNDLETDDKDMYIIYMKKYLIHYSTVSNQFDTTDIIKVADPSCGNCKNISNLKLDGNTIYTLINSTNNGARVDSSQQIVKSDNKGVTWKSQFGLIKNGCYIIIDTELCIFQPRPLNAENSILLGMEYFKIDTSKYIYSSADATIINDKDSIDRTIYYSNSDPSKFKEAIAINNDTLIAVGSKGMILMSYNGGKNWEVKSFFNAYFRDVENVSFQSEKLIYIISRQNFFKTEDGGITWLPQKFKDYPQFAGLAPTSYFFNSTGNGYVKTITRNPADTNILVTNDYGNTYTLQYNDSLTHFNYDNNSSYGIRNPKGLDVGNYILYLISRTEKDSNGVILPKRIVLRYDKNFRLVDTVRLISSVLNMILTKDSNVYCLAYNSSGSNKTDSTGNTKDYSYKYFILKSTDKGKTWDSLKIKIPIYQTATKTFDSITYLYLNSVYSNFVGLKDNYILYPTYSQSNSRAGYNLLYRYDYVNNVFDSVKIPAKFNGNPNTIFSFDNTVYTISNSNNIFYTKDIEADVPVWDSIKSSDMFANWEGYDSDYPANSANAIISAHIFNDTTGFLLIGTSQNGIGGKEFRVNLAKLSLNPKVNGISEPKIDEEGAYLWNFAPYPMPGTNMIRSRIYWNRHYNIDNAAINVYGVYGSTSQSKKIKINKIQDYMGILEWDCSEVPSGVYIIQISLAGESRSFPVMVIK